MRLPSNLRFDWKAAWGDPGEALSAAIALLAADGGGRLQLNPIGGDPWDLYFRPYTSQLEGGNLGGHSILLQDGVTLVGPGRGVPCLRLADGAIGPGQYARIITSNDGTRLNNAGLEALDIDGNVSNQIANEQVSGVLLEAENNVTVARCSVHDTNGDAVMIRGTIAAPGGRFTAIENELTDVGRIGIQMSQFTSAVCNANQIDTCGNNAIDFYGDAGEGVDSQARRFVIASNVITGAATSGIFPETCRRGVIVGNDIEDCNSGITVNRINSTPGDLNITGNTVYDCNYGVKLHGDQSGLVNIVGNFVDRPALSGLQLAQGNRISQVVATHNLFQGTDSTVPWLTVDSSQTDRICIQDNRRLLMAAMSLTITTASPSTNIDEAVDIGADLS